MKHTSDYLILVGVLFGCTIAVGFAQTMFGQAPRFPIDICDMERLACGEIIHGAYGIGSLS